MIFGEIIPIKRILNVPWERVQVKMILILFTLGKNYNIL